MRTDSIFYQLFQTFPDFLFELIGQSAALSTGYQFESREIKELSFRCDGLFLPPANAPELPIYFVEVQFQPKPDFYWRFFNEITTYLNQYQPSNDCCAVAVFASQKLDPGVPRQYRGWLMSEQVKIVYLNQLELGAAPSLPFQIVQMVIEKEETALELTKQLMQQAKSGVASGVFQQKVLELIEKMLVYKFTNLSRQELETMFGLEELKQTRYFREVAAEAKLEGELKGELKGKLEGTLETKLKTVPRLLKLDLSMEQIATALELDIQTVRQAAEQPPSS